MWMIGSARVRPRRRHVSQHAGWRVHALDAATGDFLCSTATRWQRVFRLEPRRIRGGIVLSKTKPSFILRMERSSPSTSRTARRRSRARFTNPVMVTAPRRARAAVEKDHLRRHCGTGARCFVGASTPGPAHEPGDLHDREFLSEPGRHVGGIPAREAGGSSGNPWIRAPTTRAFASLLGVSQAKPWHRQEPGGKGGHGSSLHRFMLAPRPRHGKMAWYHQFIPGEKLRYRRALRNSSTSIFLATHASPVSSGKAGVLWHVDRQTDGSSERTTLVCRT